MEDKEYDFGEEAVSPETPQADPNGYYARLGVSNKATPQEIRRAFLNLSQRYHTDKHAMQAEEVRRVMNERFQDLQCAYEVLSSDTQRAAYDAAGSKGIEHLSLVPSNITSRVDIINFIHIMEREQKLRRTARMLSFTSSLNIEFTVPRVSDVRALLQEALKKQQQQNREKENSPEASQESSITLREVEIDGKMQYVLIPDAAALQRILANKGMRLRNSEDDSAPLKDEPVALPPSPSSLYTLIMWYSFATRPTKLSAEYSFEHQVSPQLLVKLSPSGFIAKNTGEVTTRVLVMYQQSSIQSYSSQLKVEPGGLSINVRSKRSLNALWTLQSKLTVLQGLLVLPKVQFGLLRTLSSTLKLQNFLTLSTISNSLFKSQFQRATENLIQVVGCHLGPNFASYYVHSYMDISYGSPHSDPKAPSPTGRVVQRVLTNPFSGITAIQLEAWYNSSERQRFGLGVSAFLPYAISPMSAPFFLVQSSSLQCAMTLSLLYGRGSNTISIPVSVYSSTRLHHALVFLSAPVLLYRIGRMIYAPIAKAQAARYYTQQRKEHIAEMDIARQRASMEQRALEASVMQGRAVEDGKGGLVIINARYGVLRAEYTEVTPPSSPVGSPTRPWMSRTVTSLAKKVGRRFDQWWYGRTCPAHVPEYQSIPADAPPRMVHSPSTPLLTPTDAVGRDAIPLAIDVTIAMQNLVHDSSLTLPSGTKSTLVGFCDPDPFTPERKQLKIVYWFHKRKHQVVVNDEEEVEIPQREHLVA